MGEENDKAFLKDLRSQTAEAHVALEQNPVSKAILNDGVEIRDYQVYLSKMYGLVLACEKQVYPVLRNVLHDMDARFKAPLLAGDLRATGMSDAGIGALPIFDFGSPDLNQALGIMYVLEGSTLGGRVLFKHINATLGFTVDHGASYFAGYGPQTGSMWASFVQVLTAKAKANPDAQQIIDASVAAFSLINNWLSEA